MNKKRALLIVFILFFILLIMGRHFLSKSNYINADKGEIDLSSWDFDDKGIVKLDGEWEFYYNALYSPEDFISNNIKPTNYFKIPCNLRGTILNGQTLDHYGYMTFRLRIKVNEKSIGKFYGIKIQDMLTSSKVWVNGDLTAYHGIVSDKESEYKPIFKPTISIFKVNSNYVDVVIQTANFREPASLIESIRFGTKEQVMKETFVQLGIDLFLFGSLFIISLYHLGFYTMRKKNKSPLYFSLFCFDIAFRSLFMSERILVQVFPNMPYELLSKTAAISYYVGLPLFIMFLKELFDEISNKVVNLSKCIGIIMTILCIVTINKVYDKAAIPSQIYTALICLYILYKLIKFTIEEKENAFLVVVGFTIIFIAVMCDILGYNGYLQLRFIMPIGVFIFILIQSYLIAKSFSNAFTSAEVLAEENSLMYREIKEMNKELENKVRDRTKELYTSRKSIKNLLDNAKQGFLTFGEDFIIDKVYSIECKKIFKQEIYDRKITDTIFADKEDDKILFENIINEVFSITDNYKIQILLELLPEEIIINTKNISIEYKVIHDMEDENNKLIMIILTDVTEKRLLEQKIQSEQNILKMVVNAVIYYEDLKNIIYSYKNFHEVIVKKMFASNKNVMDIYYELLRKIHTYKGNFAQMNMLATSKKLDELEEQLNFIKNNKEINKVNLNKLVNSKNLKNIIIDDLNKLNGILGEDYFSAQTITIDYKRLEEIENKLQYISDYNQRKEILSMIQGLKHVSIKKLIMPYSAYVNRLSEELGKPIMPLTIKGEEIKVDKEKYDDLIKSLVHIFRNMMDHGIENIEERIQLGKKELGLISAIVNKQNEKIIIEISDDGRGIDINKIKNKLLERGLYTQAEIKNIRKEDIINYIFEDGFTTMDKYTDLSGKGVGLASVKQEVEKLGGYIKILTNVNQGTTFKIVI